MAVAEFIDSHDLGKVDAIKRDILDLYRGDVLKFAGAQKYKVLAIFNSIPAQLLSTPYVLHTKNLEVKNGVVYLPLYMNPLMATGVPEDLQTTKE